MKTILRKVYECEHCGRKMLGAGAMGRHEKWCKKNPVNTHKCFDFCEHLKRERIMGELEGGQVQFTCAVTGSKMYSFLLEKHQAATFPPFKIDGMIRMPLECPHFKMMEWAEIERCGDRNDRYREDFGL